MLQLRRRRLRRRRPSVVGTHQSPFLITVSSIALYSVANSGGDCATAPLMSDREFLNNFSTDFVGPLACFVSRLDRKIRVSRHLFVNKCVKIHPKLSFWGQNDLFFWGGAQSLPRPHPTISIHTASRPPPYWNPKYIALFTPLAYATWIFWAKKYRSLEKSIMSYVA